MITRDFILREIQQMVAVLIRVLKLREADQQEEIVLEINNGLVGIGLDPLLRDNLNRDDIIAACTVGNEFQFEKALALADLLREKGYAEKELGLDNYKQPLTHALWLYEHIISLPNSTVHWDMPQRIDALQDELTR